MSAQLDALMSDARRISAAYGRHGFQAISNTTAFTGDFFAVQCLTATRFRTLTGSKGLAHASTSSLAIEVPAGTILYGRFGMISLWSGVVLAYHGTSASANAGGSGSGGGGMFGSFTYFTCLLSFDGPFGSQEGQLLYDPFPANFIEILGDNPVSADGRFDGCATFSGGALRITIDDTPTIPTNGGDPFLVDFWFKLPELQSGDGSGYGAYGVASTEYPLWIIGNSTSDDAPLGISLLLGGDFESGYRLRLFGAILSAEWIVDELEINDGEWVHIALQTHGENLSPTSYTLFVNGAPVLNAAAVFGDNAPLPHQLAGTSTVYTDVEIDDFATRRGEHYTSTFEPPEEPHHLLEGIEEEE